MKAFVWFLVGSVCGALALWLIQETKKPSASSDDLQIAVAPPYVEPPSTPTPISSRTQGQTPAPKVVQVPGRNVIRFENGQFSTGTTGTTQGQSQVAQSLPSPSIPQPVQVSSTPLPKQKGEEVSVFLDREQQINTRSGSYRIFVHDHGSETISVKVGYGPYTRVKKAMGTDSVGDNKVLIYSDGSVRLFHVNTPRAPQNCCLIEVVASR